MLIDEIKKDMINAWKSKEILKKDILSFLISRVKNREIELHVEALNDNDVLTIIQKMLKELSDEANGYISANKPEKANDIMKQMVYISRYLPKQLTEEEIREVIDKLEDKTIPSIMKHFKAHYNGSVDMSLVSRIAKEIK